MCQEYCQVLIGPPIREWGQGHLPNGDPGYMLDGAAGDFVGGSPADRWLGYEVREFANGAVGRTDLTVISGITARVRVIAQPVSLAPMDGGAREPIPAAAWLGHEDPSGRIRLYGESEGIPPTGPDGLHLWLYVCAQRRGLEDPGGTYAGTVVVEIMPE